MKNTSLRNISAKIEQNIDKQNATVAMISSVLFCPTGNPIFSDDTHYIQAISEYNSILWTMKTPSNDDWQNATHSCAQIGINTYIFIGCVAGKCPPGVDAYIVKDHINVSGQNPLIGENDDRLGPRFPDMTDLYNKKLSGNLKDCCEHAGLTIRPGTMLVPRSLDERTALEEKILSLRKDIFISEDVFAGAIVAKHQSLTAAGLVLNSEIDIKEKDDFPACLCRQFRSV